MSKSIYVDYDLLAERGGDGPDRKSVRNVLREGFVYPVQTPVHGLNDKRDVWNNDALDERLTGEFSIFRPHHQSMRPGDTRNTPPSFLLFKRSEDAAAWVDAMPVFKPATIQDIREWDLWTFSDDPEWRREEAACWDKLVAEEASTRS